MTTSFRVRPGERLEIEGIVIERSEDGARGRVYLIDRKKGQVYSLLSRDQPTTGGAWFGQLSEAGRSYVAGWHRWAGVRREVGRILRAQPED